MMHVEVYPNIGQRVIMTLVQVGEPDFQLAGVVTEVAHNGSVNLRLVPGLDEGSVDPSCGVIVDYPADGGLYRLHADIDYVDWPMLDAERVVGSVHLCPPLTIERKERRAHYRLPIVAPLRFRETRFPIGFDWDATLQAATATQWAAELDRLEHQGHTQDLSAGGIRMSTEYALHLGSELFMEIEVPKRMLYLPGRVVVDYAREYWHGSVREVGVQFVGVTSDQEDWLLTFVYKHGKRSRVLGPV